MEHVITRDEVMEIKRDLEGGGGRGDGDYDGGAGPHPALPSPRPPASLSPRPVLPSPRAASPRHVQHHHRHVQDKAEGGRGRDERG